MAEIKFGGWENIRTKLFQFVVEGNHFLGMSYFQDLPPELKREILKKKKSKPKVDR